VRSFFYSVVGDSKVTWELSVLAGLKRSRWASSTATRGWIGEAGVRPDILGPLKLFFYPPKPLLELVLLVYCLAKLAERILKLTLVHKLLKNLRRDFFC